MKFKVGDKARVLKSGVGGDEFEKGEIVEILNVSSDYSFYAESKKNGRWYINPDYLKLVKENKGEKNMSECYSCGEKGAWKKINGDRYCPDCRFTCEDCGELAILDDSQSDGNITICSTCYDDHYDTCYECETLVKHGGGETVDGNSYCPQCIESDFFTCDDCGEICHNNDYAGDGYCNDCYHSNDNDGEIHKKLVFTDCTTPGEMITIPRYVGIEIEAEHEKEDCPIDETPDNVNVHYDGSLDRGKEFVPMPTKLLELEKRTKDTCKAMKSMGYYIKNTCGLHIHIDAKDIKHSEKAQDQVALAYLIFEPILLSMLPEARRKNRYCYTLLSKFQNIPRKLLENAIQKKLKLSARKKFASSRYNAINFTALDKYGTIEIRSHSGTMEAGKILRWIDINLHIVEYSKSIKTSHVSKFLKLETPEERVEEMVKMTGISKETYLYMKSRIERFK